MSDDIARYPRLGTLDNEIIFLIRLYENIRPYWAGHRYYRVPMPQCLDNFFWLHYILKFYKWDPIIYIGCQFDRMVYIMDNPGTPYQLTSEKAVEYAKKLAIQHGYKFKYVKKDKRILVRKLIDQSRNTVLDLIKARGGKESEEDIIKNVSDLEQWVSPQYIRSMKMKVMHGKH